MKPLKIVGILATVVAVALLGVLISTMISAVFQHGSAARDASQHAQCFNNLKQIGMAISRYSQSPARSPWSYDAFPPGTVPRPTVALEKRCGWASMIYYDQDAGRSGSPGLSTELAWDDPLQQPVPGHDLKMFCPSCPKPSPTTRFVPAVYIGIAGLGVDAPALATSDKRAGIFGDNRVVFPSDVTDGLSQTMMVVDSSTGAGPWFAGGRNTVRGLDPSRQPYIGKGQQFGGIHAGGANVLMADGSVRFVKDTVAPKVFEGISTIAGGEKVSVP